MKTKRFNLEGVELIEREVKHYERQPSRIIVPNTWKKVIVVRVD